MRRTARARVDIGALRHNLAQVAQHAPDSRVLAVIKANGYGHGLVQVARALEAADGFGVATLDEAITLRKAGISVRIVLLEGCFNADELPEIERWDLEIVVHQKVQLQWLENYRPEGSPLRVWLKVDTGMHRLGFATEQAPDIWQRLMNMPAVARPVPVLTHLANADDPAHPSNACQLEDFQRAVEGLPGPFSIANSAAIMALPQSHADWVRPGIMLYGVSPFLEGAGAEHGLRPVMTLSSHLFVIRHCRRGDAIGYGGGFVCPEDMPVGVVAIGYGDGYPRHAVAGTPVLVNGVRVPLIGRVSMDMITVDLRPLPDARIGDPVVLWGEGLPVEEIARASGTIAYELLCKVTSRVEFQYLGE